MELKSELQGRYKGSEVVEIVDGSGEKIDECKLEDIFGID
jgi:hypothetical protein